MYGYGNGPWMFGGGFSMLLWIVVIALVVAFAVHLAKGPRERRSTTALDILKERYARGEIEKDEFERKKRDLG